MPSARPARSRTCSSRRASCATSSTPVIRAAEPADAEAAGRICYEAFREIAERVDLDAYAGLGFAVREILLTMQGDPIGERSPGFGVRAGSEDDLAACNELCLRVHGHDRGGEALAPE